MRRLLLVGTVLLPGCDLVTPVGCDAYATHMFSITVINAQTGSSTTTPPTIAITSEAIGDSTVATFNFVPSNPFGIPEQPGWGTGYYTMEIRVADYQTWRREGLLVRSSGGRCPHMQARSVTAELVPL